MAPSSHAWRCVGLLLSLLAAGSEASIKWAPLACPKARPASGASEPQPQCTQPSLSASEDSVVSLFMQVELTGGEQLGSVVCSTETAAGPVVHCRRTWLAHETGSSGSCWFMLAAGQSYSCEVTGTVNFIGSNSALLSSKLLVEADPAPIPSLHGALAAGASATHTAGATDEWLALSWSLGHGGPLAPLHSLSCTYSDVQVCSWSANTTDIGQGGGSSPGNSTAQALRASSCGFLLPAGEKLECTIADGGVAFGSATTHPLRRSIYGKTAAPLPDNYTCPDPPTPMYPDGATAGNPCDCGWKNPRSDTDIVLAINALSVDDGYNNFFCYAGVQQASFGADSGNRNDGGSSYFILGAGETLHCEMQYGELAWPSVSVIAMEGPTIFLPSTASPRQAQDSNDSGNEQIQADVERGQRGAGPPHSRRSIEELRRLWREWRVAHGKQHAYPSAEEELVRFENFCHAVALADTQDVAGAQEQQPRVHDGGSYNSLADLSLDEFGERYRGCSLAVPEHERARLQRVPADLLTVRRCLR
jgi:hypothetical protein